MHNDREQKTKLKIELKGTKITAIWNGSPLFTEELKENEIAKTYKTSRWIKRIVKLNNVQNYDIRILYALDELNWYSKMMNNPKHGKIRKVNLLEGIDFVSLGKMYIKELAKGDRASKENVPFAIEYDLNDTKGLTIKEKSSLYIMAKKHKKIASVKKYKRVFIKNKPSKWKNAIFKAKTKNDKNKIPFLKRTAAITVAAISLIGGVFGIRGSLLKLKEENSQAPMNNTTTIVTEVNNVTETTQASEITRAISTGKTLKTTPWSIPQDQILNIKKETNKIIAKHNMQNTEKNVVKTSKKICFGEVINGLPENLSFQEGIDGGSVGFIGNCASPVEGFYVVDYSCKVTDDGLNVKYSLDGSSIDADWVHISLVKACSIEEAKSIISENKLKDKGGNEDLRIEPRGWVKTQILENIDKSSKSLSEKEK